MLTPEDIEAIAHRVAAILQHSHQLNLSVTHEQHADDHAWVKERRTDEAENSRSRRKVIEQIIGSVGALGVLGTLGWIGHAIINSIADALKAAGSQ